MARGFANRECAIEIVNAISLGFDSDRDAHQFFWKLPPPAWKSASVYAPAPHENREIPGIDCAAGNGVSTLCILTDQ
jgi:hypothetical protein